MVDAKMTSGMLTAQDWTPGLYHPGPCRKQNLTQKVQKILRKRLFSEVLACLKGMTKEVAYSS